MPAHEQILHFVNGKGFIAALDQSGGSTPKVLRHYGVEDSCYTSEEGMMELIHAMRVRTVTSPAFNGEKVLGTILFKHTIESKVENMPIGDYLWHKRRVLPLMKIDVGLAEREGGVSLMKRIPNMFEELHLAYRRKIFGTKMRSVIHEPIPEGVKRIVEQQFEFANIIIDHGLVPIIEPEVTIDCAQKEECETLLRDSLLNYLNPLDPERRIALKLTLPEIPNFYEELVSHPNVLRVTALSGGYDREEACRRLAENNGMIASFSRALAEGLRESMTDEEFNSALGKYIETIYQASIT